MKYRNLLILLLTLTIQMSLFSASIFIWDNDNDGDFNNPDTGEVIGTEYALQKALEDNGLQYEISTILPDDLSTYDIVFIALGKYCFG